MEYEQYLPKLAGLCSPSQFFTYGIRDRDMRNFANDWWTKVRFSSYCGYAYVTRFTKMNHLISSLAGRILTVEDFNHDWTLTEQGEEFKARLRARWEHKIKIKDKFFYFSSARQLLNVILDHIEEDLKQRCDRFIDQLNSDMEDFFGSMEFDGVPVAGQSLREALGLRSFKKDYGITMQLRQMLYAKGYEKNASELIKKFSEEPIENLVSSNYLDRIVGLIQSQDPEDF